MPFRTGSPAAPPPSSTASGRPAGRGLRLLAVVGLVLYSEGFLTHFFGSHPEGDAASPLRFVWPPLYLATILVLLPHLGALGRLIRRNWPLALAVAVCLLSTFWSLEPGVSVRRGAALLGTTLFGLWLAVRFAPLDRLRALAQAFAVIAVGSLLMGLLLPRYGIMSEIHPGAWSGAFTQKNKLGQMMVFGAAILTVLALADPARRVRAGLGAALCVGLVLLSTSVTSLIALALSAALIVSATVLFRNPVVAVLTSYLSVLLAVGLTLYLMLDPDGFFALFGRDASLTGRTDIWEPLRDLIAERFWLGYGYGAFWDDPEGPAWYIRKWLQWDVPSAHNGWIELWLDAGVFAVAAFALAFGTALGKALLRIVGDRRPESLWVLLFLCLFLVFSLSESSIMRQNNLVWVMYVAVVAPGALARRRRAATLSRTGPTWAAAAPAAAPVAGPRWRKPQTTSSPRDTVSP